MCVYIYYQWPVCVLLVMRSVPILLCTKQIDFLAVFASFFLLFEKSGSARVAGNFDSEVMWCWKAAVLTVCWNGWRLVTRSSDRCFTYLPILVLWPLGWRAPVGSVGWQLPASTWVWVSSTIWEVLLVYQGLFTHSSVTWHVRYALLSPPGLGGAMV